MVNLDDKKNYRIDKDDVYSSISSLPKQVEHASNEALGVKIPNNYKEGIKSLIMCGMGGSGLAARIIESLYLNSLKIPITRVNNYNLPASVGKNSLIICSSYSSETEETLSNAYQAIKKGAKWMAIGTSGSLITLAKKNNVPYYEINPLFNPSKHPRMALGYSIIGQLILLSSTGVLDISKEEIKFSQDAMQKVIEAGNMDIPLNKNKAKKYATDIKEKIPVIIGSGHLLGALHSFKNQLNENSKNFSAIFDLPELNHHLLEGFLKPSGNPENLICLIFESLFSSEKISKRFAVTKEILAKYEIKTLSYKTHLKSKLAECFEIIQFASFVSYYLAILYKINPGPIPWVDFFKKRLNQPLGKWK